MFKAMLWLSVLFHPISVGQEYFAKCKVYRYVILLVYCNSYNELQSTSVG